MNRLPVDVSAFGAVLAAEDEARPVKAYEAGAATGQQATDEGGVPLWRLTVLLRQATGVETVPVKFPARVAPSFATLEPVAISGLSAFVSSDGKTYFSAAAIAPVSEKSASAQSR